MTVRGAIVIVLAAASIALGALTHLVAPLAIGLMLAAGTLVAWTVALSMRHAVAHGALRAAHRAQPSQPAWGTTVAITVAIDGRSLPRPLRLLTNATAHEEVHAHLAGYRGTVSVPARAGGWQTTYHVAPTELGTWPLGNLRLRFEDPLGLIAVSADFADDTHLIVVPRILAGPAQGTPPASPAALLAAGRTRGARGAEMDDSLLREYAPGDDVRRVHWPSSARRRTLMVRTEESAPIVRATVCVAGELLGTTTPPVRRRGAAPASAQWRARAHWPTDLVATLDNALRGHGREVSTIVCSQPLPPQPLETTNVGAALADLPDLTSFAWRAQLEQALGSVHGDQVFVVIPAPDAELLQALRLAANDARGARREAIICGPAPAEAIAQLVECGWVVHPSEVGSSDITALVTSAVRS
ncbi:DUF58 domain-containing protein [Rarobacter incanus]|nr:DUF58 domain-containing protein [Rarobacter incanus]